MDQRSLQSLSRAEASDADAAEAKRLAENAEEHAQQAFSRAAASEAEAAEAKRMSEDAEQRCQQVLSRAEASDAQATELKQQLRHVEQRLQELQGQHKEVVSRAETVSAKHEQKVGSVAAAEARLQEKTQQLEELNARYKEAVSHAEAVEAEKAQQVSDAETRCQEATDAMAAALAEAAERKREAEAAEEKCQEAMSCVAEAEAAMAEQVQKAVAFELHGKEASCRLATLEDQLEAVQADAADTATQLEQAEAQAMAAEAAAAERAELLEARAMAAEAQATERADLLKAMEARCHEGAAHAAAVEVAAATQVASIEAKASDMEKQAIEAATIRCQEAVSRAEAAELDVAEKAREASEAQARLAQKEEQLQDMLARCQGLQAEGEQARELRAAATAQQEASGRDLQGQVVELKGQLFATQEASQHAQRRVEELDNQLSRETRGGVEAEQLQVALTESQQELGTAKKELDVLRFAKKQAELFNRDKERAEEQVKQLKMDAEHWQRKFQCIDVDHGRLQKLDEDLQHLTVTAESQRMQNRQLVHSVEQLSKDWEQADTENRNLCAQLKELEAQLDRATDANAKLIGHTNARQKIQHTLRLKEENSTLRADVKKARARISQLEVATKGESVLDALSGFSGVPVSVGPMAAPQSEHARSATPPHMRTPRHASGTRSTTNRSRPGSATRGDEGDPRLAEADRRCQAQALALERIRVDFQHFAALVERVIPAAEAPSGAATPATGVSNTMGPTGALLERLRIAAAQVFTQQGTSSATTGAMIGSKVASMDTPGLLRTPPRSPRYDVDMESTVVDGEFGQTD